MTLSVTHYDKTLTFTQPDDANAQDMLELFRSVMFVMGFHPNTVNSYLPLEGECAACAAPKEDQ